MYVIDREQLESQGVSDSEVKKSLQIECFESIFQRSSDLPKKYKKKALDLCQEFNNNGIRSFITETNYSYTVWKESKPQTESSLNPRVTLTTTPNTELSDRTTTVINPNPEYRVVIRSDDSSKTTIIENLEGQNRQKQDQEYQNLAIVTSVELKETKQEQTLVNQSVDLEQQDSDSVTTYRGVAIAKSVSKKTYVVKRKQLTYRGLGY
jgi:hypothetical protein